MIIYSTNIKEKNNYIMWFLEYTKSYKIFYTQKNQASRCKYQFKETDQKSMFNTTTECNQQNADWRTTEDKWSCFLNK